MISIHILICKRYPNISDHIPTYPNISQHILGGELPDTGAQDGKLRGVLAQNSASTKQPESIGLSNLLPDIICRIRRVAKRFLTNGKNALLQVWDETFGHLALIPGS